jgi:hypothetical protein
MILKWLWFCIYFAMGRWWNPCSSWHFIKVPTDPSTADYFGVKWLVKAWNLVVALAEEATCSLKLTTPWKIEQGCRLPKICDWKPIPHDGSMVLLYMVTWIPSIYPLYVGIYTSTMDPSWVLLGLLRKRLWAPLEFFASLWAVALCSLCSDLSSNLLWSGFWVGSPQNLDPQWFISSPCFSHEQNRVNF